MKPARALLALFSALVGCSNVVTFMPLGDPPRQPQPHPPDEVEIFLTRGPPKPYAVVGLIQSGGGWASEPAMIAALKREGGKRGCEAVFLANKVKASNTSEHRTTDIKGDVYIVTATGGSHTVGLDAYCIMYAEAPTTPALTAAEGAAPSASAPQTSEPTISSP